MHLMAQRKNPDPDCLDCKGTGEITLDHEGGIVLTLWCRCTNTAPEEVVPMHERYV